MAKKQENKKNSSPEDLKDLLLRTQANFENYRKQSEKRLDEMEKQASKNIIIDLLPILDNFELAMKNVDTNKEDFLKGIELIYSQFKTLLQDNDVKPIETKEKMFDPFFHEALMKVESDLPENTIIEEFQKGFMLNDVVIRHAKVKVSAGKKND